MPMKKRTKSRLRPKSRTDQKLKPGNQSRTSASKLGLYPTFIGKEKLKKTRPTRLVCGFHELITHGNENQSQSRPLICFGRHFQAPLTRPNSPKPCNNKATPRKVEIKSSRTPNRALAKSNNDGSKSKNLQGKTSRGPACSPLISRPKRTTTITHENTSPNIQCGIN